MNIPTYTISTKIIDLVAQIAEKLGEIRGSGEYSRNLRLSCKHWRNCQSEKLYFKGKVVPL